jgi:hypothetical protein
MVRRSRSAGQFQALGSEAPVGVAPIHCVPFHELLRLGIQH